MFVVALLTDALDGVAARRWPYPTDEQHWWRKDPHLIDNIPDGALTFAVLIWLAIDSPLWWWVIAVVIIGTGAILFLISFIGRYSAVAAEKIDVVYGWTYAAVLVGMLMAMTVNSSGFWSLITMLGSYPISMNPLLVVKVVFKSPVKVIRWAASLPKKNLLFFYHSGSCVQLQVAEVFFE